MQISHAIARAGAAVVVLSFLAACSEMPEQSQAPSRPTGQTLVYECGEYEFVVRTGPGQATVYLPEGERVLEQVQSASGSKYTDSEIVYWSKGESALLDLGNRRFVDCPLNRERGPWEDARRRGVDFRAVGQEPGWVLEIQHDRNMLLIADYGSRRVLAPTPEPDFAGDTERYSVPADQLQVDIRQAHCVDTMSGARYTHRVTVRLADQLYRGCGLSLEPR